MEYGYDDYGRKTSMKTYRGGSGWDGSTWPGSPGTADETTWTYEEATGLLTRKTYADSKYVDYTYTSDGKFYTRTWSRTYSGSNRIVTTYSYGAAGNSPTDLTGITYTDGSVTPNVEFTYNRLGKQATVTDLDGKQTFPASSGRFWAEEGLLVPFPAREFRACGGRTACPPPNANACAEQLNRKRHSSPCRQNRPRW